MDFWKNKERILLRCTISHSCVPTIVLFGKDLKYEFFFFYHKDLNNVEC
jgi:hypothetical protein